MSGVRNKILKEENKIKHLISYELGDSQYLHEVEESSDEVGEKVKSAGSKIAQTVAKGMELVKKEYNCLPDHMKVVVDGVIKEKDEIMKTAQIKNKDAFFTYLKYALATIKRETDYGIGSMTDVAGPVLRSTGYGWLMNVGEWVFGQQSLGPAQFTQGTWDEYGLDELVGDFDEVNNVRNAIVGTMIRLVTDYKYGLRQGLGTGKSINPILVKSGQITSINGTGNHVLDMAIVAHNRGRGFITKYCTTVNPFKGKGKGGVYDKVYMAPCGKKTYKPHKNDAPDLILKVNQNQWLKNYFPSMGTKITSIGYLEEVQEEAKDNLGCIKEPTYINQLEDKYKPQPVYKGDVTGSGTV
jgi:hypothetical protein